jgi:hypothetical protein
MLITLASARLAVAAEADSAVTDAILKFVDALEAGDAKAMEKLICADSTFQERGRKTFIDLACAQKALERSAMAKFGEEGKRFRCGFDLIVNGLDRKAIASARVVFDDPMRFARVEKPGELLQMQLRRNQDNQWQVVLEHIEWDDDGDHYVAQIPYGPQPGYMRQQALASIRAARNTAVLEAFKQTQARIESGELTSAAAAQEELNGKLAAASVEAAKARAAVPSNRPSKDR